uniref:Uncharacterized protein n=1 Tax=Cacopsylla melanoneura TaxID=428564 RepID=A0A8D8QU05_9HEMI
MTVDERVNKLEERLADTWREFQLEVEKTFELKEAWTRLKTGLTSLKERQETVETGLTSLQDLQETVETVLTSLQDLQETPEDESEQNWCSLDEGLDELFDVEQFDIDVNWTYQTYCRDSPSKALLDTELLAQSSADNPSKALLGTEHLAQSCAVSTSKTVLGTEQLADSLADSPSKALLGTEHLPQSRAVSSSKTLLGAEQLSQNHKLKASLKTIGISLLHFLRVRNPKKWVCSTHNYSIILLLLLLFVSMVASGKFDVMKLIPHNYLLEDPLHAFETAKTGRGNAIKVMIHCKEGLELKNNSINTGHENFQKG